MPQDKPEMKNLLLLWLTVATPVGPGKHMLLQQMTGDSDAARRARHEIGTALHIPEATVATLVETVNDPRNREAMGTTMDVFHQFVPTTLPSDGYIGKGCPFDVSPILELVPARTKGTTA